jgi:hypothetical protein
MTKVICINGTMFALPEGMSAKDIQALAGFLVTLAPVTYEYDYDKSDYMHYISGKGVEVRVDNVELVSADEAKAHGKASRERYEAKRAAEKAAAAE